MWKLKLKINEFTIKNTLKTSIGFKKENQDNYGNETVLKYDSLINPKYSAQVSLVLIPGNAYKYSE